MTLLIVGGSGFLGTELVRQAVSAGRPTVATYTTRPGSAPALTSTPLAKRPYDLRHSALSTWLCAGADPAEVAQRAGNSVEVLLSRYAKCLYDRQFMKAPP
jgi:nucleoside-diphosphate-sugar epimerase